MAKKKPATSVTETVEARSSVIAANGISHSGQLRSFLSALISDVVNGKQTPQITNAACNVTGKMLKMVELECRYGTRPEQRRKTIQVAYDEMTGDAFALSEKSE